MIFFTKILCMCSRSYFSGDFFIYKNRPKTKHWAPTQLTSIHNKHTFLLCTLWGCKKVTNLKQNSKCAPYYFFGPGLVVTWSSPIYSPGKLWLGRGLSISIHPSIHSSWQQMIGKGLIHPSIHPSIPTTNDWWGTFAPWKLKILQLDT